MSGKQAPSAAARHAVETLDLAVKGAKAYERDDLVQRLSSARRLLTDSTVTVHVVGEFKQGKSSLVNGLLTAPVCPVDDDVATCVPTEVRYSPHVTASATFESMPGSGGSGWTETIPPGEIATYASEAGNPDNKRRLTAVTVGLDRPLLSSGLVLVDTPGVGGIGSVHHATTVGSLPQSHAVLFVTDASQELTAAELRFLRTVQELCPTVVLVLTKIDLYPHWMRIAELDHAHLQRAGVDIEMIAVSSELRSLAATAGDQALNAESGYPALVGRLGRVVAEAERLALDAVVVHVVSAIDQMEATATARRDALVDPANAAALLARLSATKERADALRERSSKWQVLLQDGFADIASDVEFDLRQRSRAVLHEAEAAIDDGDPAKNWEQFEEWLRERLAGEAMENYALFVRRAKEVAATVGEHFELAESEIVTARTVAAPVDLVGGLSLDAGFTNKKAKGALGAAFNKTYGGVLMFTMLPAIVGLAVPLPVGLLGGALLGGHGYREERKRQLERRRQEAKTAVRRVIDDFNLQVGKDSRDAIRHVQRELRTSWGERVAELQRSAAAALSAAQAEAKGGESDAGTRERIESDLATLQRLRARIEDLRGHLARIRTAEAPAAAPAAEAGVPA
ncbi:dynamin family protein [Actinomycetospora cinnamomea]|uniref:Dynamin family protein n=1 Tax=Actinomycetospora cinnamomea TaxID=663609 RepID=A0A2U1F668_9PSEU|nr:dynamin family protein [Actinomycetospora cinnamomea]PVZ07664.1 dynamin family protein [Actinomycetospora cinnamomea]